MKTVFDAAVRQELIERANKLSPDSVRRFGTMRPDQSLHHVNLMLRTSLGESGVPYHGNNVKAAIMRMFFFSPLPIPPGRAKAPQALVADGSYDLEAEKVRFRETLDRLAAKSAQTEWPINPVFGRLSREQHGIFAYKESDHHLNQFGV